MERVTIEKICDVTGDPADETLTFGLDGTTWEIDVTSEVATDIRNELGLYIDKARKLSTSRGGRKLSTPRGTDPARPDPAQRRAIREWGKKNGYTIGDRGRLPLELLNDYEANAGRPKLAAAI